MIDLRELEQALRDMQPRQAVYELVKAEMVRRGRWKAMPRGWHILDAQMCSMPPCDEPAINGGTYCGKHEVNPWVYGVRQKTDIPGYTTWRNMLGRCYKQEYKAYKNYGARGISVCQEWRDSFDAFYQHMGVKPSPKHSLDRIDNDGNYEPGNVRWADTITQNHNRRGIK